MRVPRTGAVRDKYYCNIWREERISKSAKGLILAAERYQRRRIVLYTYTIFIHITIIIIIIVIITVYRSENATGSGVCSTTVMIIMTIHAQLCICRYVYNTGIPGKSRPAVTTRTSGQSDRVLLMARNNTDNGLQDDLVALPPPSFAKLCIILSAPVW